LSSWPTDRVRVGAVGDTHMDRDVLGRYRPALEHIADKADVLLLAGDLTRHGTTDEARCVAEEFGGLAVPVVAVLGNHDYHSDQVDDVVKTLEHGGIQVLECTGTVLDCHGVRLGIAGAKGFGGGFAGRCGSEFGEPEMKAFIRHTRTIADAFGAALRELDCDIRVALMHYAPIPETLLGEPPEIYPFLGSYLLAEAVDSAPTDLAVHGHAHAGSERGATPGGVRVRNVAHPVIKQAYNVYQLSVAGDADLARTARADLRAPESTDEAFAQDS
jgi:Icc-related predicted phosphoesterase